MTISKPTLAQAIWNIFPGDTVRLRVAVLRARGVPKKFHAATAKVASIQMDYVRLETELDEFYSWNARDLVVVKKVRDRVK
jgi:hypothetical protein